MESNQEKIPKGGSAMQIRDIEILYDALTKYYWRGNVLVYASFTTLPRGRFIPDSKRIILKEESYDVAERRRQRYPLRLLVKTPEHSSLLAQSSSYPDTQATFFISPSATDAACTVLFYVFTSEQDRKLCCPYSAGSSILLMNTELRQVLEHKHSTAIQIITQELFLYLPMHSTGFRKLEQSRLHGFVVMKESRQPSEPDKTKVCYWCTTGLQSTVQLTVNIGRATCFRISSACDDDPVLEESSANYLVRSASLFIRDPKETRSLDIRASQLCPKLSPTALDLQYSPTGSLPNQPYPRAITPISYNVFVRDTVLIWSALNRYILELGWKDSRAYSVTSVLLPYYPPHRGEGTSQQLQVPLQNRRSLRVRAHNETGEGFPNYIFVNQNMTITSDNTAPLFQAIYFIELTETSQVVILCYVSASGRQLVLPSYQEEARSQLKMAVSENLASLLDREDTEQATRLLVERVFPHLLPKQGLDKYLFRMQGTHNQFSLLKPIPPKYYYWKIGSDTCAVNMTINSTEAAIFQLNATSS